MPAPPTTDPRRRWPRLLVVVLVKELRETLRDVNALLFSVLFPLLFFPAVVWLFTQVNAYTEGQTAAPRIEVHGDVPLPADAVRVEHGADAVARREGDVVRVEYRSTLPASNRALGAIESAVAEKWPITLTEVAPDDEPLAQALGRVVPLVLVVFSMLGGLYPAVEAVVAERERGTVETTMVTGAPRWIFFAGKLGSVVFLSLLALGANMVAIGLTFAHLLAMLGAHISFPMARLAATLPIGACVAVLASSLSLLAAAPTRSFKQAQNTTSAAATVVCVLAGLGMVPGTELNLGWALVPITNAVLVMSDLISGRPVAGWAWLAGIEMLLLSAVTLYGCARIVLRGEPR